MLCFILFKFVWKQNLKFLKFKTVHFFQQTFKVILTEDSVSLSYCWNYRIYNFIIISMWIAFESLFNCIIISDLLYFLVLLFPLFVFFINWFNTFFAGVVPYKLSYINLGNFQWFSKVKCQSFHRWSIQLFSTSRFPNNLQVL